MTNKSFLNKLEELKPQVPVHLEIERKLIPRLKFMGYVMLVLCLASFIFALTIKEETAVASEPTIAAVSTHEELEAVIPSPLTDEELEFVATEVLNFYAISFVFGLIGVSCFLIAWRKRKTLFQDSEIVSEPSKE